MRILIVGAGGHAHVVADLVRAAMPDATIVGHLDDDPRKRGTEVLGRPVLGPVASIGDVAHDAIALAIGDNHVRAALYLRFTASERMPAIVHPRATVAPSAVLGPATVVFAGGIVNAAAVLGADVIVNTGATIDHQCELGDHAHTGPGSHVNGGCHLGAGVFLTTGVIVGAGRAIGEWTTVGAGSTVLDDLPSGVLAHGTPARVARPL